MPRPSLVPRPPPRGRATRLPDRLRCIACVAGAVAALVPLSPLEAQTARPLVDGEIRQLGTPPQHAIDQWTAEDGLPQNSINAIVQGPEGHLWLGTFGGLVRFDGTSFTVMSRVDSTGRHVDRVLSLAVAPDGALWVGTETGLLRRKDGIYEDFPGADALPDDEITALFVEPGGVGWIGTGSHGIVRLTDGAFQAFGEVGGEPIARVNSIIAGADGKVWVNAGNRFFTIEDLAPSDSAWRERPLDGAVHMVLQDRAGALWFTGEKGLSRMLDGVARSYREPTGHLLVEDADGGYWVGTGNDGLFFFRPHESESARYALPDGRIAFRVRSAHVDSEGNVWIGTSANGLLRAKRNLFTTYSTAHGLSHDVATAIYEDRTGTVWVGTNCGGVNAIDLRLRSVQVFNPRSPGDPDGDPCIFSLAESADGTMWQGTYGGGLTVLSRGSAPPVRVRELRDSVVLALYTDRAGTMWVGTRSGGLAAVRDGRVVASFTTADGLVHNSVRTIHQTRDGDIWIGTLEGLSRLSGGHFVNFTAEDGLSTSHVRAVYEDTEGDIWVGTYGGGINRFRDGEFTPVRRQDGLADDVVSSILEDGRGQFWMSGNRGIFSVPRSELIAFTEGAIERVHSILYRSTDGLLNTETNGGFHPAGWKDRRGQLWFPTLEGVAVIDPARVSVDSKPTSVTIEEVVVDGAARPPGELVEIGPGRPNLEIRYTGLSLSAPEHLTFRYRLEGFDDGWVNAGTRRVAYYPRLTAGRYRFVVAAANRDGVWNQAGTALQLRVVPSVWNAWWFRAAALITLAGLVAAALWRRGTLARQRRAAQHAFSSRLIESQEHERTRIARELHDGLGQELLIVRNRALLALRSDALDAPVRDQLRQITQVVDASLENVRGLAHNLTPRQLHHLGLSSALGSMAQAMTGSTDIVFETSIENIDGLLPIESEINLYRILQEGLNNIVRHSGASAAMVRVWCVDDVVRVTMIDQGVGFEVRRDGRGMPVGGFGLSGMAERVRILQGRIELVSAPGRGTRIDVFVPAVLRRTPLVAEVFVP